MTLSPRPRSTAADLIRLLAAWLAAIVLVQGFAAAQALGLGPLHRHAETTRTAPQHHPHNHHHHHDGAERHHHDAGDSSVLAVASTEPAFDEAAFALVAALAAMAFALARPLADTRHRHVWRAAPPWARLTAPTAPLRRPPRRA